MSTIIDDIDARLAVRLRAEREARGWTLADLAERSGVSRAMISKLERAGASPTAALLGRLSGAFGLTLSTLLARAEGAGGRLARREDQDLWRDPETGYSRRAVSPPAIGPLELVEVELPPGARVPYPASAYAVGYRYIWVVEGELSFDEGETQRMLAAGDCLLLGSPADCVYENRGRTPCRYLVAVVRQ